MAGQGFLFKILPTFGNYRSALTNRALGISYQQTAGVRKSVANKLEEMNFPKKPKRPLSPYLRFANERRAELMRQNPKLKITEIITKCAQEWNSIDEESKDKYRMQFKEDMTHYIRKHLEYEELLTQEQKEALKAAAKEKTENKKLRSLKKRKVKDVRELNFPETIPQQRQSDVQYITALISTLLLITGCAYTFNGLFYIWTTVSLFVVGKFLVELLFRFALICEEINHVKSRYNGSFLTLLSDTFIFSRRSVYLLALSSFSLLIIFYEYGNPIILFHSFGASSSVFAFIGMSLASRLFDLDYGPLYQSLLITKLKGLDYGSAMAYTFFHGYLQIILPYKGTEQKGMKELMQDFESTERIKIEIHKLIVLIPLSLYSPINLEECSEMIEQSKSLPDIVLTRAGVRERIYKNTVYKIKDKYYVAEYATPLQTLYDIVSRNNAHAHYYKKHSKELALQFYLNLKNILCDNPDSGNFCEVLFFDDKDDQGNRIDVGQVILNHLKNIKSAEKKRNTKKNY